MNVLPLSRVDVVLVFPVVCLVASGQVVEVDSASSGRFLLCLLFLVAMMATLGLLPCVLVTPLSSANH